MKRDRNVGIDLLRLICMSMIVLTHLLLHGGLADVASPGTVNYWVSWMLVALGVGAVNCFAMITGFVSFKSMPRVKRGLELWFQVLFYTLGITVIAMIIFPQYRNISTFLDAIFPVMRNQYWYMTAYFGLILFMPFLNVAIENMSKEMLSKALMWIMVVFVAIPLCLQSDPFTNVGYSMIWLMAMYILGAFIGKYGLWGFLPGEKNGSLKWLMLFFIMIAVTFLSKVILVVGVYFVTGVTIGGGVLYSYTSPTIVLASIFLLMSCASANFKPIISKVIEFLAPASLGIYLWHAQPIVWNRIFNNCTVSWVDKNPVYIIILIGIIDVAVCCVGLIIDLGRIQIFKFVLRKRNEA